MTENLASMITNEIVNEIQKNLQVLEQKLEISENNYQEIFEHLFNDDEKSKKDTFTQEDIINKIEKLKNSSSLLNGIYKVGE